MRRSTAAFAVACALILVACGTGPDAPTASAGELVCNAGYCVTAPQGWNVVETGGDFVSFSHPETEAALATVGMVNMEALVTQAGFTWPTQPETVVRAFWDLLAEGGDAEFSSLTFVGDGSVRSTGTYGSGRLWDRLIPLDGGMAIGMEVRGPNRSWETHADIFLDSLMVVP